MVLDAVANFVRGTSTESINDSQTTIPVDDASIFPDPSVQGEFNVVIWDANNFPRPDQDADVEILRVTARDTDANELTVTRAQEMTSAASHPEGSAIHLSPTAKMFSDIESTFGDFWDADTEELTADVNNTNTTTQALEAERINTPPTGGILLLDQDQTIAADTITAINWDSEETKGDVSSLLDNGSISIPSGYSFAKFSLRVRFSGSREPDVYRFQKNGNNFDGSNYISGESLGFSTRIPPALETPFVSVSENDTIDAEIRVPTEVDIQDSESITHCEVLLL